MIRLTDETWLRVAREVALLSSDAGRKVGAVIRDEDDKLVVSAFNGMNASLAPVPKRLERPTKYLYAEHAERRAIYQAAKHGQRLIGCTMYLTWFPCADCARAIAESGIVELVYARQPDFSDETFGPSFQAALSILHEMDVKIRCVPCE